MPNLFDISGKRKQIEVDFAEWLPDHPPFGNPGFPNMENALPADLGFYRPMRKPVLLSTNSLTDLVPSVTVNSGQIFGIRADAGIFYYTAAVDRVADTLHLFQYVEDTDTWQDVTPASAPSHQPNDHAFFATFGTRIYVGFSTETPILAKDIGTVTPFAAVSGAPNPRDIIVTRGFLVGIHFRRGASPTDRIRTGVTWSASGDPENWIDPVADPTGALAVLRGETQLEGGGRLQRIIPGVNGADAIIFGQSKIWRMSFIGSPSVWDFQIIHEDEGTPVPTSVVSDGSFIYFMGRRGWMRTDGANVTPIGAGKVDRAFIGNDVLDQRFEVDGATLLELNIGLRAAISADPFTDRMVFWTYQAQTDSGLLDLITDTGDTIVTDQGDILQVSNKSDFNDTLLVFNEVTGRWGNAKVGLLAIGRVETFRTRLDAPRFVGLDVDLNLVAFETIENVSETFAAFFESAEGVGPVNNRVTISKVWPYVDSANCTVSLLTREKLSDPQTQAVAIGIDGDASVPIDDSGRFVALRLDIPESDDWIANLGLSVELSDQGTGGS